MGWWACVAVISDISQVRREKVQPGYEGNSNFLKRKAGVRMPRVPSTHFRHRSLIALHRGRSAVYKPTHTCLYEQLSIFLLLLCIYAHPPLCFVLP